MLTGLNVGVAPGFDDLARGLGGLFGHSDACEAVADGINEAAAGLRAAPPAPAPARGRPR
jgi:hypothetical protein